jgi:hypothetical protein
MLDFLQRAQEFLARHRPRVEAMGAVEGEAEGPAHNGGAG